MVKHRVSQKLTLSGRTPASDTTCFGWCRVHATTSVPNALLFPRQSSVEPSKSGVFRKAWALGTQRSEYELHMAKDHQESYTVFNAVIDPNPSCKYVQVLAFML